MNDQKQTSTERVKAHQARAKERKQLLSEKGLVEISLIVSKDEVSKIKAMAKMMKINEAKLLHVVTQPAIKDLCQRHDDIFIRRYEEQERLRQEWCDNNPELLKELLNSEV
jgi:hypothetical protein